MRAGAIVVASMVCACVRQVAVPADALRYPAAAPEGEPIVVRMAGAPEDDDRESIEIRQDSWMRFRLRRPHAPVEARARDVLLSEGAVVVVDPDRRRTRRIPWEDVRWVEVSETRPWLAFAVLAGSLGVVGLGLALAEPE